jgi:hypothetical protein
MTSTDTALLKASFGADGVVHLPGILDTAGHPVRTAAGLPVDIRMAITPE